MPIITLREVGLTETGFDAELRFDGRAQYAIHISDPFTQTPTDEDLLEWYFEEWIKFPFTNRVLKEQAERRLQEYGQQLFEQVFRTHPDAYSEYSRLRGNLSQVQIEIEGQSPEFQALHWEAMRDPQLPRPLAVDAILVRKHLRAQPVQAVVNPSPVINLLVVTSRPDEDHDVGYRTISRPLIEAIQTAQLRVNIELLRPGTFEALARHLAQLEKKGFYHIIHFDVHGALATYEQLQQGLQQDRYVYLMNYGQSRLQPYEGVRAYLFFDGDAPGQANPVEASDIANLLTGAGIPVCILNACQSGKQLRPVMPASPAATAAVLPEGERPVPVTDQRETSLGSRLMSAGMQMVVAMGYSVTVSAAKLLMEQVYRELFNQRGMTEALRLGRSELFQQKSRKIYYDKTEDLEDWLLPVVYCNQTVDLNLRPFTPQEKEQDLLQRRQQFRFSGTEYGFVGRDLDILKLEKALFKHNVLLVQGMGGTGKTTLLTYLQEWWQTTKFARQVFYFGYDTKAWTLEQMVLAMGQQLYDRFDSFHNSLPEAKEQQVIDSCRSELYILMLDNLESVMGQALAIQNTLPEAEQTKLRDFLQQLVGGRTRVVLGSRSPEAWLERVYRDNVYALRGLDKEAQSDLATRVLERQVKDPERVQALLQEEAFKRLLMLLAGYPLAMEVVLANLRHQSPQEVLEGLQAADVSLDTGSEERTQSILKCVEYSHSRLSPQAQQLLLCLAPFSGFIDRRDLGNYVKQLQPLDALRDHDFGQLEAAVQDAINWGLLAPYSNEHPALLTIQPVFPYFLKTRLATEPEAIRTALETAFANHYRGLAGWYEQMMDAKEPDQRQMGVGFCKLEYENLFQALQICLQRQESFTIYRCLDQYLDLSGDVQQRLQLGARVYQTQQTWSTALLQGALGWEVAEVCLKLGNAYLQTQNDAAAQTVYEQAIRIVQQNTTILERNKQAALAAIYHQLGNVAQEQRQYDQSEAYYQQALALKIEFNDRYSQARTYHQLGLVAQLQRQYDQAEAYYQQALALKSEFNDRYSQARTYHQLGRVAEEQRQYDQAHDYYQQALALKSEFNDRYNQARTYHQLGLVAQLQRQYDQAEAYYQQALALYVEFNDRYEQAGTYGQLGIVAQAQRQYDQAEAYLQQALALFIEFNDRYEQASTYHQLGLVAQLQRQYDQAEAYYQQALALYVEFNDRYEQAGTYGQLGIVAQAQRQYDQAEAYLQQALALFIEFNDRYEQAGTYHNLGIVAQLQRHYDQSEAYYQQALALKIEFNDRYSQASTYFQLGRVAEALGHMEEAKAHYLQDLQLTAEVSDEAGMSTSLQNLARFYQMTQDEALLESAAVLLSVTPTDFKDWLQQNG